MRILNRPMFRYGGPIKEGLMHGIRSKYAGGRRAALVGDPVFPRDSSGRSHHVAPAAAGIWYGAQRLARLAPTLYRAITGAKNISKAGNITKNLSSAAGAGGAGTGWTGSTALTTIPQAAKGGSGVLNKIKNWFKADPLYSSVAGGTTMLGRGIKSGGQKIGQFAKYSATTPSGLAFFGIPVVYAGGKYILSSTGEELNKDQINQLTQEGPPGGGETSLGSGEAYYDKPPKTKSAAELAAEAKAARTKKLNKYLDTMGYDKAKKTALGDALIDASAIVQGDVDEAGSLKKADWGRMINKAIQTTSKRLDKPEQIREAVGLMMTKADIEKDATAETDALNKLYKTLQIKGAEKTLAGETLQESIKAAYQRTGKFPTGSTLAGVARTKGIEVTKVIPTTEIPDDMSAIDYISIITEKAKKDGNPMPKGHYVIKDRLVEIDENGDIIKQLI